MHTGQVLDLVSRYDSLRNPLTFIGIASAPNSSLVALSNQVL